GGLPDGGSAPRECPEALRGQRAAGGTRPGAVRAHHGRGRCNGAGQFAARTGWRGRGSGDRKSTRLNSSHVSISYAVFCLKENKLFLIIPLPSSKPILPLPTPVIHTSRRHIRTSTLPSINHMQSPSERITTQLSFISSKLA